MTAKGAWTRLLPLGAGLLFAAGLAVSGMTRPEKVVGFLDFTGRWDPSLAFVMAGGVTVYMIGYRLIRRRGRPFFAERFSLPTRAGVDRRLVAGAALFGVGWGLSGFCPGPALVSLAAGVPTAVWFAAGMAGGMLALHLIERRLAAAGDG